MAGAYGSIRLRQGPIGSDDQRLPTVAPEHTGDRHRLRLGRARGKGCQLQFGRSPLPERIAKRAAEDLVHQGLLEKPHFGLVRVHVDVDSMGGILMNRWTSGLRSLIVATV